MNISENSNFKINSTEECKEFLEETFSCVAKTTRTIHIREYSVINAKEVNNLVKYSSVAEYIDVPYAGVKRKLSNDIELIV